MFYYRLFSFDFMRPKKNFIIYLYTKQENKHLIAFNVHITTIKSMDCDLLKIFLFNNWIYTSRKKR